MPQPRICSLIRMKAPVQSDRGYLSASGATVPTDGTDGYQTGAIFCHTDGGVGTCFYINEGSVTSCAFVAVAGLTAAQEALLGATAGVVTASKAVIVDANKDAGDFRNLDCVNLDAGASGTAGTVDIFPATASRGKLTIASAINTDDFGMILTTAVNSTSVKTVTLPNLTGYAAISTAALTLAEVDVLDDATMGDAVASKVVGVDANKAARIGAFASGGVSTGAVIMAAGLDKYTDGQLDVLSVFGASTSDLTSAKSAKCGRFRHIATGTGLTIAHETYGVAGQMVVKGTTLTHLHAGILGTFEGHTSGAVSNGAYAYSVGAILARVGGGAAITATKDVCGVISFLNGAAMASGGCSAFAAGDSGSTGLWTNALAVERATNALALPAAGTAPVATGGTVGTHGTSTVKIAITIGGVTHYLLASTVPTFA